MISTEPRRKDDDVAIITHGGATMGDDSLRPQIWLVGKNKVNFDVNAKRYTFF